MMIFFYSGARITELMRLKVHQVGLEEQKFKVLVLKGKINWDYRTIRDIALPF